ncbi:MAG TPA: hypothetical protein VLF93_08000 [Candidatus Saccharimonadales bacterium]|nr:hypothetical protein [Candidatus Saccharimonadales bacterium]
MKNKKRLENNSKVQKRLEEEETIEKKDFAELLKKAVRPSSQKPA